MIFLTYNLISSFGLCFQSRLKPGRMLLVDTETRALIQDIELKTKISKSRPYGEWLFHQVNIILKDFSLNSLKVFDEG